MNDLPVQTNRSDWMSKGAIFKKAVRRVCPAGALNIMRRIAGVYHPPVVLEPRRDTTIDELISVHLCGAGEVISNAAGIAALVRGRARTQKAASLSDKPGLTEKNMQSLEKIMRREFMVLGEEIRFEKEIDWSSDFRGGSWKKGDCEELNSTLFENDFTGRDCIGDIKVPWEFNKHLHFFTLARAYAATGDEKYAGEFAAQAGSWLEQNPFPENVAWTHPLIVAQRAITWVETFPFFAGSPEIPDEFWARFVASLYDHSRHIEAYYERPERPTNHLIGNLVGTLAIAAVFPEFDRSEKRQRDAWKELLREINRQVHPDGADYEGSFSYHKYVLEFCLYAAALARRCGKNPPRGFLSRVEKMAEFLMHVMRPDGRINLVGDADGARVLVFDDSDVNDCRAHLALAAVLFGRGDFKYVSRHGSRQAVFWLLGEEAVSQYEKLEAKPPARASAAFSKGGYYTMRSDWSRAAIQLHFDCANIGRGCVDDEVCGSHGHDDLLSIGLNACGQPLLHDLGSGAYTGNRTVHDYMRSARGHNTVVLGDAGAEKVESHSVLEGFWCLGNRARPLAPYWYDSRDFDFVTGAHDGYRRFNSPVVHRRSILFIRKAGIIFVFDTFFGEGGHPACFPFHFAPGLEVRADTGKGGRAEIHATGAKAAVDIVGIFHNDRARDIRRYLGSEQPFRGWYSPDYGQWEPGVAVEIEAALELPACSLLVLNPRPADKAAVSVEQKDSGAEALEAEVRSGGEVYSVRLDGFAQGTTDWKRGGLDKLNITLAAEGGARLLWQFRRGGVLDNSF